MESLLSRTLSTIKRKQAMNTAEIVIDTEKSVRIVTVDDNGGVQSENVFLSPIRETLSKLMFRVVSGQSGAKVKTYDPDQPDDFDIINWDSKTQTVSIKKHAPS
jgi:hypothetical protein